MNNTPSRLLVRVDEYELVVDVQTKEVTWRDSPVIITGKPYLMLEMLLAKSPDLVGYRELYEYLYPKRNVKRWRYNMSPMRNVLSLLRNVLLQHDCHLSIKTVYSKGLYVAHE